MKKLVVLLGLVFGLGSVSLNAFYFYVTYYKAFRISSSVSKFYAGERLTRIESSGYIIPNDYKSSYHDFYKISCSLHSNHKANCEMTIIPTFQENVYNIGNVSTSFKEGFVASDGAVIIPLVYGCRKEYWILNPKTKTTTLESSFLPPEKRTADCSGFTQEKRTAYLGSQWESFDYKSQ